MDELKLRQGDEADTAVLLGFVDDAVAWMNSRGNTGQWGTEPWSSRPDKAARVRAQAAGGNLVIAEIGGVPAGAVTLNSGPPPHIATAEEPEIYIGLLITSRRFAGKRVGSRLIEYVLDQARQRGIGLVRVDCYAGGDGELVRYYERQGFQKTATFDANGWPGQVFQQRVARTSPPGTATGR
ncbi:GNAT family N-acetyltransferase [Amycolatopsis sp. CA-230715]|uniref:GNAT family N-acetyltransferase n=1 Tax=Amycolatopsis sp. CA-230715 TaxID=2745196 RepID=UPI0020B30D17|nr:GNAT family N-acetyltransferase [Amycolatopsis sp. CA-230715]